MGPSRNNFLFIHHRHKIIIAVLYCFISAKLTEWRKIFLVSFMYQNILDVLKHYSYISMIWNKQIIFVETEKWTLLWLILVLIIGFLFLFNLWFCAKTHFLIGYPFLSCQHHVSTYKTLSDSIHASYSTHP